MRLELLAFDLLVLGPPLVASLGRSSFFVDRWVRAWPAALAVSLPAAIWLGWLTASGVVSFSSAHSLAGSAPLGLPIGAVALLPAVAFACVFCWWVGFGGPGRDREGAPEPATLGWALHALPLVALGLGLMQVATVGASPAALALLGLGLLGPLDLGLRTKLIPRPRFWGFLGLVAVLTIVFGGALIEREIVAHAPEQIRGLALIGVPVEDLGFALSLAGATVIVFELLEQRAAANPRRGLIARLIERRLGGYRHQLAPVDASLPETLERPRRVAVIGSGLAGLGAAAKLAARGFAVTLFERNAYLGGKLGAWKTTMPDGREIGMSHGFHAFFHHYYNLNECFAQLGIDRHYRNIGDYLILTIDGRTYSFKDVATTPILNLLSLARHGVYDLREVARSPTGPKLEAMFRYDPRETFAEYDQISYAQFAEDAQLPDSLKLVFNTFARAFFSDADTMSMAELIKSFHFYYLSNDGGLIYEYLDDDYDTSLLAPLRAYLDAHGVDVRTGCAIEQVTRTEAETFELAGETFDYLIVASDVVGTRELFQRSPTLVGAAPQTAGKVATLEPGQRYSVLRLWLDRDVERELPGFVITDRVELLDAVTFVHQIERESADWVAGREAQGEHGAVVELHCYAVPEQLPDEAVIRERLLAEMVQFFPELADAEIVHEVHYVNRDFPAFHVGKHATRPSWDTELPNLFLAGDWVVLPFPAMLMEAAYSAGLLAANAICRAEGLREEPVFTVPLRGFMAGWPKRPF